MPTILGRIGVISRERKQVLNYSPTSIISDDHVVYCVKIRLIPRNECILYARTQACAFDKQIYLCLWLLLSGLSIYIACIYITYSVYFCKRKTTSALRVCRSLGSQREFSCPADEVSAAVIKITLPGHINFWLVAPPWTWTCHTSYRQIADECIRFTHLPGLSYYIKIQMGFKYLCIYIFNIIYCLLFVA